MVWVAGESGNPNGRMPAMNAFRAICYNPLFAKQAFDGLMELTTSVNEAIRLKAWMFLVEHGFGRAPQSIEVKMAEKVIPAMMTTEQLKLAAAGQTQELVRSLLAEGSLDEIARKESEEDDSMLECARPIKDIPADGDNKEVDKVGKRERKTSKSGKRTNK